MTTAAPNQRIDAWSYNRLKDFEKCAWKAWLKYGLKRPEPDHIDKEKLNRGKRVHTGAELYIKGEAEIIDELITAEPILTDLRNVWADPGGYTITVEDKWGFDTDWGTTEYFGQDVWARMSLDALVIDTQWVGNLYDWKTGKKFGNEVSHAQQGQVYAVGTFMRYPELREVSTNFVYTDQKGAPTRRTYTREQAMQFLPSIDKRARAMTEATEFPPKPNKINCKYCPYSPNKKYGDGSCDFGVEA